MNFLNRLRISNFFIFFILLLSQNIFSQDTLSLPAVQSGSMVTNGKFLYMFGGLADSGISINRLMKGSSPQSVLLNDLSVGDPEQNKWAKEEPIDGIKPEGRTYQKLSYDNSSKSIYLFSGFASGLIFNDMWKYEIEKKKWTKIDQIGTAPTERILPSLTPLNERLIMIGGKNTQGQYSADCWIYYPHENRWERKSNPPSDREFEGHQGVKLDEYSVAVWGGDNNQFVNEVWTYNINSDSWNKIITSNNGPQNKRGGFIMEKSGNKIYIGGGTENFTTKVSDFYSLDLTTWQWTKLNDIPAKLFAASSVVLDGKLYVYGGNDENGNRSNKVYEYTLLTNQWNEKNPVRVYPPKGPSNTRLAVQGERAVFYWEDNSECEDGFIIERNCINDNKFTSTTIEEKNLKTYTDITVETGREYSYRVGAFNFAGTTFSDWANILITDLNDKPDIPLVFHLEQNYPNPFNPTTKISFTIPEAGHVSLKIFDILGREIETLVSETKTSGSYEVLFDGASLPSGTYFYKLISGKHQTIRKMLLVK